MGEPAGIGPEITLLAWRDRARLRLPAFAYFGDPDLLHATAERLRIALETTEIDSPVEAGGVFSDALPVVPIKLAAPAVPGAPDARNAAAVIESIRSAVLSTSTATSSVVTNPIAKEALFSEAFPFPGHTEYLAVLAKEIEPGTDWFSVMMLASSKLKVVPLTVHTALASVPGMITRERIRDTVRIMAGALDRDFGHTKPRIVITGLNPHAGEAGLLGHEERDIIAPAVQELQREGYLVQGPLSADSLFHAAARRRYEAVLAMYHDQALIPFKTLSFNDGVNVTLGLPFVRTSPDHGTAFDIAGLGLASPASLIAALTMASAMAERRANANRSRRKRALAP